MTVPVAIVTGGSSGIGELTARQLKERGYTVYAAARRTDRMKGLERSGIRTRSLDLTVDRSMKDLVDVVMAEQGRIDLLINNAGFGAFGAVETVSMADARAQFEVNVFGLARMTQLVLPQMRTARRGRVVNVSSIAGYVAEPYGAWYHASKHAVEGLSDCLRMEMKPFGVDIVLVEPGPVRTEWNAIAANSLVSSSRGTPYAKQAKATRRALKAMNSGMFAVPASRVAEVIVAAAMADRPSARYPVGRRAAAIMAASKYLPTRAVDGITGLLYHAR